MKKLLKAILTNFIVAVSILTLTACSGFSVQFDGCAFNEQEEELETTETVEDFKFEIVKLETYGYEPRVSGKLLLSVYPDEVYFAFEKLEENKKVKAQDDVLIEYLSIDYDAEEFLYTIAFDQALDYTYILAGEYNIKIKYNFKNKTFKVAEETITIEHTYQMMNGINGPIFDCDDAWTGYY